MLEAEWAFPSPDGVHGVCNLTEALLRDTITDLVKGGEDMNLLMKDASEQRRTAVTDTFSSSVPWTHISYTDAIKELEKASSSPAVRFAYKPEWGRPLQSEHERWLAETLIRGPVFVTDYPASFKPFYMRVNADEKTVACFDLLVPHVGELIGGSVREERYDVLEMPRCAKVVLLVWKRCGEGERLPMVSRFKKGWWCTSCRFWDGL
jgi:asparaginyl-tRNA synthetase